MRSPLAEMVADLRAALCPDALMRAAGMEPDPWQSEYLTAAPQSALILCHRQAGKSTVVGVAAAHMARYNAGSLTLLLSPSMRQSSELARKTRQVLDRFVSVVPVQSTRESVLQLELANGSRIVSLPGKEATIRGYSGVDLLAIDEASRVPDALYYAVRPMLAVSGGRIVAMTTPFGKRGWFYESWQRDGWYKIAAPAAEVSRDEAGKITGVLASLCPRIPVDFLRQELEESGEWWFAQEYMREFRESVDQVFSDADVFAALSSPASALGVGSGTGDDVISAAVEPLEIAASVRSLAGLAGGGLA